MVEMQAFCTSALLVTACLLTAFRMVRELEKANDDGSRTKHLQRAAPSQHACVNPVASAAVTECQLVVNEPSASD